MRKCSGVLGSRTMMPILLVLALVSNGCVQLKEIRAFAATAGDVGDRFPILARDLYDSCLSQQRYIVAQKNDFRIDRFADLNNDDNPLMAEGLKLCKLYKDEQNRLIKANGTLVNYMKSMGDLAADDLTNFDKSIEGFGGALTEATLLTEAESSAVTKLASLLSRIVTEGYRRKKLKSVIKDTNPDVQLLTSALSRIVNRNYVQQLRNEQEAMKSYYRELAAQSVRFNRLLADNARGGADINNPVPLDDLKTKYETKNAAIKAKINGAEAYAKILGSVAKGHQELHDNADKLRSRTVLTAALAHAKTIHGSAAEFREAF